MYIYKHYFNSLLIVIIRRNSEGILIIIQLLEILLGRYIDYYFQCKFYIHLHLVLDLYYVVINIYGCFEFLHCYFDDVAGSLSRYRLKLNMWYLLDIKEKLNIEILLKSFGNTMLHDFKFNSFTYIAFIFI